MVFWSGQRLAFQRKLAMTDLCNSLAFPSLETRAQARLLVFPKTSPHGFLGSIPIQSDTTIVLNSVTKYVEAGTKRPANWVGGVGITASANQTTSTTILIEQAPNSNKVSFEGLKDTNGMRQIITKRINVVNPGA